jgi:putative FmdB family regulatory protein
MPTYDFVCDQCKHKFEISIAIKDYDRYDKKKCPKCKNSSHTRRFFSPVGVTFGKGFFKDGYQSAKDVNRSEE